MNRVSLPSELGALVAGATWQDTSGESGSRVFRLTQAGNLTRYLKISPRAIHRDLRLERDKLSWLRQRLPVPEVLAYAEDEEQQYLLSTAVPGVDATEPTLLDNPQATVHLLAHGLRQIHEVDAQDCPFDRSTARLLVEAGERVSQGLVDAGQFDEERTGYSPQQALESLRRLPVSVHGQDDECLLHGDYCFPNIIINLERMRISGYIDLGGAGLGDRYFDLALAERSIRRNVGPAWVQVFFEAYGLSSSAVNWDKIRFFQHLDEFF